MSHAQGCHVPPSTTVRYLSAHGPPGHGVIFPDSSSPAPRFVLGAHRNRVGRAKKHRPEFIRSTLGTSRVRGQRDRRRSLNAHRVAGHRRPAIVVRRIPTNPQARTLNKLQEQILRGPRPRRDFLLHSVAGAETVLGVHRNRVDRVEGHPREFIRSTLTVDPVRLLADRRRPLDGHRVAGHRRPRHRRPAHPN